MRRRERTAVQEDGLPQLAHVAHQCMASPSACHQAPTPAPGLGAPQSHVGEVGPNQALQAAATCILPPKGHRQALAQGVTLKLDQMQTMNQKMKKMRALLARALAVMEDQKMKVQITEALEAWVGNLAVRMRSQAVAAAVPQSQRRRPERSNQMVKCLEVPQRLTLMP